MLTLTRRKFSTFKHVRQNNQCITDEKNIVAPLKTARSKQYNAKKIMHTKLIHESIPQKITKSRENV